MAFHMSRGWKERILYWIRMVLDCSSRLSATSLRSEPVSCSTERVDTCRPAVPILFLDWPVVVWTPLAAQQWRIRLQCRSYRRHRLYLWVGKIPWRNAWQPTPLFLLGESQGQRSLAAVHGVAKSWTQLKWLSTHTHCWFLLGKKLSLWRTCFSGVWEGSGGSHLSEGTSPHVVTCDYQASSGRSVPPPGRSWKGGQPHPSEPSQACFCSTILGSSAGDLLESRQMLSLSWSCSTTGRLRATGRAALHSRLI